MTKSVKVLTVFTYKSDTFPTLDNRLPITGFRALYRDRIDWAVMLTLPVDGWIYRGRAARSTLIPLTHAHSHSHPRWETLRKTTKTHWGKHSQVGISFKLASRRRGNRTSETWGSGDLLNFVSPYSSKRTTVEHNHGVATYTQRFNMDRTESFYLLRHWSGLISSMTWRRIHICFPWNHYFPQHRFSLHRGGSMWYVFT